MYVLSAADAISPAIARTRDFLFRPFRWSTFLKLCLVAILTEGWGSNLSSTWRRPRSSRLVSAFPSLPHLSPGLIAGIAALSIVGLALGLLIAYLITRLRFAFFHCLIHNSREIRPGWRLYRSQALRFFAMNLVVGFCFLLLTALIALPFAAGFWRLLHQIPPGGRPNIGLLISLVLPLIPVVALIVVAAVTIDVVLRDWMLPHYALENATAGQAWAAVRARMSAEKGPFFLYVVLRVLLPIAAVIALFIVMILPAILFAAVIAGMEIGIHVLVAGAGGAVAAMGIGAQILVGLMAFCAGLVVWLALGGPLSTGVREYALLFYGGRYQALGDILYPPAPGAGTNAPATI